MDTDSDRINMDIDDIEIGADRAEERGGSQTAEPEDPPPSNIVLNNLLRRSRANIGNRGVRTAACTPRFRLDAPR